MFHLVLQRILHKKWMVASLLIGNILLIAIAVSHPMYQAASKRHMLTDYFVKYMEEHNTYPMVVTSVGRVRKESGRKQLNSTGKYVDALPDYFGVDAIESVTFRSTVAADATPLTIHDSASSTQKLSIASLNGLKDHTTILSGSMYSSKVSDDGFIEAIIPQSVMVEFNLLVGEELEFEKIKNLDNTDTIKIRVVGVFTNSDDEDLFWLRSPDSYSQYLFIDEGIFETIFLDETAKKYQVDEAKTVMFDYTQLRPENVDHVLEVIDYMTGKYKTVYSAIDKPAFVELLNMFKIEEKQVSVTLSILQVPVIVLIAAFIFMISRQMLEMEENEIALLKSRGATRKQVLSMYFMQSAILSGVSLIIGLGLGAIICKCLGAASAFLQFSSKRSLSIEYTGEVFLYALAAVAVSIIMTILPVLKRNKVSIVAAKRKKSRSNKPFWQKFYLDVVILAVSLYGLYTFNIQQEELMVRVLSGKALDPLLFLSSSLFIVGAGMVSLRLHSLIIRLVYAIGKKKWKPAAYTSFLQLIRTGNKQAFIMVFLVLTVAFGMFNTTVARTILANAENNLVYTKGADVVINEYWRNNAAYAASDPDEELVFTEPDFGKYGQLGADGVAKVFIDNKVIVKVDSKNLDTKLMAIDTAAFGHTTDIAPGLLKYDYYDYLNVLSTNPEAVLLSSNYRDKLGMKIGDRITYRVDDSYIAGSLQGVIYGFFDYWPSYAPTSVQVMADETIQTVDNYLIVAHLTTVQEKLGVFPYQIWINMGGNTSGFYEFADSENLKLTSMTDAVKLKNDIAAQPLFQGTNGILTMSFITILLICAIGYVIYWMLSIRSRELLFGIFRAMGMTRSEIIRMLVNEQAFTGIFGIVFGLVIGWLASKLYVPIIQIAYSAADRVLPLELITKNSDIARLVIIIVIMFLICIGILIRQVFRMKISQALKLGED